MSCLQNLKTQQNGQSMRCERKAGTATKRGDPDCPLLVRNREHVFDAIDVPIRETVLKPWKRQEARKTAATTLYLWQLDAIPFRHSEFLIEGRTEGSGDKTLEPATVTRMWSGSMTWPVNRPL
jgi:hypothetical protein